MNVDKKEKVRRTQAERRATTRRALLDAAREMFAERGYHGAAAEEIVRRAGVTRGAMYHHFEDKRELFRAVVEEIETEVDEAVLEAARGSMRESGDPLEAWMAGFYASLDVYSRPDVRRIQLVDSPAVLSWEEWLRDRRGSRRRPDSGRARAPHGSRDHGEAACRAAGSPVARGDDPGGDVRS